MYKFILVIFIIALHSAFSEEATDKGDEIFEMWYGIKGGANYIQSSSRIPLIPGGDDCGFYEKGTGNAFYFGANFGISFFDDILGLEADMGYEQRPAFLQQSTASYEVFNPLTSSYEAFVRNHEFSSQFGFFYFLPKLLIKPLSFIPIYISFGYEISNPNFNSNYENIEKIVSPEGVLFPNQRISRIVEQGEFRSARSLSSYSIGLKGRYEVSDKFRFTGEILQLTGLNSISSLYDWNLVNFRAGIGFEIVGLELFDSSSPKIEEMKETPSPKELIVENVDVKELEEKLPLINSFEIKLKNIEKIALNETVVTQTFPLLPYFFFDEGESKLKTNYTMSKDQAIDFLPEKVEKNNLSIYYRGLDIIGYRMSKDKSSKIKVIAYTDGTENLEKPQLAMQRANSVKSYIVNNYNIAENRIIAEFAEKPPIVSSEKYTEGVEENRRVEIIADNKLLEPIVHYKFLEYNIQDDKLYFDLELNEQIKSELTAQLHIFDNVFSKQKVEKNNGKYFIKLDNNLVNKIFSDVNSDKLELSIEANFEGQIRESKDLVKSVITKNNYELGRLNLIVFDFNRSEISDLNKSMLNKFLLGNINDNSLAEITGSTDRLGEMQYNQKLSEDRAKTVAEITRKINPKLKIESVKGIGMSNLLFDNSLPEGRFYCRTVLIEVKTPVKP